MEHDPLEEPKHPEMPANPEEYLPATALTSERLVKVVGQKLDLYDDKISDADDVHVLVPSADYTAEYSSIVVDGPDQARPSHGQDAVASVTLWHVDTSDEDHSYTEFIVRRRPDGDYGIDKQAVIMAHGETRDLLGLNGPDAQDAAREAAAIGKQMDREFGLDIASESEAKRLIQIIDQAVPERDL